MDFNDVFDPYESHPVMSSERAAALRRLRWGTDEVPVRMENRDLLSDQNTELTDEQEKKYRADNARNGWGLETDYDYRGLWLEELKEGALRWDPLKRLPDRYKKTNHAAFSSESKYAALGGNPGTWTIDQTNGSRTFTPDRIMTEEDAEAYRRRFAEKYPGAALNLEGKVVEDRGMPPVLRERGEPGIFDNWGYMFLSPLHSVETFTSDAFSGLVSMAEKLEEQTQSGAVREWQKRTGTGYAQAWIGYKAKEAAKNYRQWVKDEWEPIQESMGLVGQIGWGFGEILTEQLLLARLSGSSELATWLLSGHLGARTSAELAEQGVDPETARNAGLTTAFSTLVGLRLPAAAGRTRALSIGYGAATNVAADSSEILAINHILNNAGYEEIADEYQLTPTSVLTSMALGAFFGRVGWVDPKVRAQEKAWSAYSREVNRLAEKYYKEEKAAGPQLFKDNPKLAEAELALKARLRAVSEVNFGIAEKPEYEIIRDYAKEIEARSKRQLEDLQLGKLPAGLADLKGDAKIDVVLVRTRTAGARAETGPRSAVDALAGPEKAPAKGKAAGQEATTGKTGAGQETPQTEGFQGIKNQDAGIRLKASREKALEWVDETKNKELARFLKKAGNSIADIVGKAVHVETANGRTKVGKAEHGGDGRQAHRFVSVVQDGGERYRVTFDVRSKAKPEDGSPGVFEIEDMRAELLAKDAPAAAEDETLQTTVAEALQGYRRADGREFFDDVDITDLEPGGIYYRPVELYQDLSPAINSESRVARGLDDTRFIYHGPSMEELLKEDPEVFAKNLSLLTQIPGMKGALAGLGEEDLKNPVKVAEVLVNRMADNLDWIYEKLKNYEPKDKDGNPVLGADGKPLSGWDLLQRAILWYDGGNKTARYWAGKYGIRLRQAAGVIAVYSPQTGWFVNLSRAERTMDIWRLYIDRELSGISGKLVDKKGRETEITFEDTVNRLYKDAVKNAKAGAAKRVRERAAKVAKGEAKELLDLETEIKKALDKTEWQKRVSGRTLRELIDRAHEADRKTEAYRAEKNVTENDEGLKALEKEATQRWREAGLAVRAIDETVHTRRYRVQKPEGGSGGWARNKDGTKDATFAWMSFSQIANALKILENDSPAALSEALGSEFKVRDFYCNLYRPDNSLAATIDTHQVGADAFSVMSSDSKAVGHAFANGKGVITAGDPSQKGTYPFHFEAVRRAAAKHGLLPRQMQSAAWEAIRSLFPDYSKKALRPKVDEKWTDHDAAPSAKPVDKIRQEIYDLAGGFHGFAWMKEEWIKDDAPDAAHRIDYNTYERGDYDAQLAELGFEQPRPEPFMNMEAAPDETISIEALKKADPALAERLEEKKKAGQELTREEKLEALKKIDPEQARFVERWWSLSGEEQAWVTSEMVPWLVQRVSASLKTYISESVPQLGGWGDALNSSYACRITGGGDVHQIARLICTYLRQNSVYVFSDKPAEGLTLGKVVMIKPPAGFTEAQLGELYKNYLREIKDADGERLIPGMSTSDGVILIGVDAGKIDDIKAGLQKVLKDHLLAGRVEYQVADAYSGELRPFSKEEIESGSYRADKGGVGEEVRPTGLDHDLQAEYEKRFFERCDSAAEWTAKLREERGIQAREEREYREKHSKGAGGAGLVEGAGEGSSLYQTARGEGKRLFKGSYNPDTNTIKFTPLADISTFCHEHAHYYLEQLMSLGRVSPYDFVRADIDTLLDFWKIGGENASREERLAAWDRLGREGQRKYQEQFAAWTEIYLSEGRVTARGLEGVFQRLANWIRGIYHDAVGKEIGERYRAESGEKLPELSPEVEQVLKHMFAAQDAEAAKVKTAPRAAVAAARALQTEQAAEQKASAPLANPSDPAAISTGRQAMMKAVDDINSGRPVDVSEELRGAALNEEAISEAEKALAREMQGDTPEAVSDALPETAAGIPETAPADNMPGFVGESASIVNPVAGAANDAAEARRETLQGMFDERSDAVRAADLVQNKPDGQFAFTDDSGNFETVSYKDIPAVEQAINERLRLDRAGLAEALVCIARNRGLG